MSVRKLLLLLTSAVTVLLMSSYAYLAANQETEDLSDVAKSSAPGKLISLSKGTTHYLQQGPDTSQLIVFIHGGGITGLEVYHKNIPFFTEKGYQVLAYDLYGRGYSDRPEVEYTPVLFNRQLCGLLDTLKIRKPFHIMAMSMGAMIALDYAADHPERVGKVVLVDPAVTGDFKPNILLKVPLVNTALMTMYWYPNAVENQRKEFVNQELFNAYRKRLEYFMNFRGYKFVNYSTWMNTLGQSKIHLLDAMQPDNILLVYGDHDPYFPQGNLEVYIRHYPSLQARMIGGAGHMPHLEKPEEVNAIVHSFFSN